MAKVIHVHLTGKRKDYYFGSVSAVFTVLTPERLVCRRATCCMRV